MIYDTFLFANEIDLLEVRLQELGGIVDKFVLVESKTSHRGTPKPLFYSRAPEIFSTWGHKIDVVIADHSHIHGDNVRSNGLREKTSREALDRYPFKDNSTIIYGDADEIVRASVVKTHCPANDIRWCDVKFYHYFFNCLESPTPPGARPVIAPYSAFKREGFEKLRWTHGFPGRTTKSMIPNGGWHFSYFGDAGMLREKIAWAVEGGGSDWIQKETDETLLKRMQDGRQYDGTTQYHFTDKDDLPKWVQENWETLIELGHVRKP